MPRQRHYCSQTPKSTPLGHPAPELLSGHGGAERCRHRSPRWHAAGHQPRGKTHTHGETCPPQHPPAEPASCPRPHLWQTHRRWLSPRPRSSNSPAPRSPPPSAAKKLGVKVPQRPAGACQPSAMRQSRCSPGGVAAVEEGDPVSRSCGPFWGQAAPGDSVAGAGKAALGCAGSSHSIYPRLRWRHRPPQWQGFAPPSPQFKGTGDCAGLRGHSGSL